MPRRGAQQLVSVMCAKDRADAEAGLEVPTSEPLASANSRSRSTGRSCRSVTALQKFAPATSPLALLSNLDSAAGVGADSAAHPMAAKARRGLDVSVEMDRISAALSDSPMPAPYLGKTVSTDDRDALPCRARHAGIRARKRQLRR